jgi:hypothetical protein
MPIIRTIHLAIVAVAVLGTADCGPVLYYGFQQNRTYEFERRVPIVVRSDPAGAMIMTTDGQVLGQAPLIVEEKVRVRRRRRYRSNGMALLGCIFDFRFSLTTAAHVIDYLDNDWVRVVGVVAGLNLIGGCAFMSIFSELTHQSEEVIPRVTELRACWDGLAATRVQLILPTTRTATLRLPRRYTFDEALILWARESNPPPTAENLYLIGNAYRSLAFRGAPGAMERATRIFTLYLERHSTAEHAESVRRALHDFRRPERCDR